MSNNAAVTVVVERFGGGPRLVIEDAELLALDFFLKDVSSVGEGAYDAHVDGSEPDRITVADIVAINSTMRARSPHSAWESLTTVSDPLPWLVAIPRRAHLFTMSATEWSTIGPVLERALTVTIGPYRNLSVATKVLHLKRPHLFPVLDRLVIEQIGGVGRTPMVLLNHLRAIGIANIDALHQIDVSLRNSGIIRSDVRILDALLWSSHPTAGIGQQLDTWERRFLRRPPARP